MAIVKQARDLILRVNRYFEQECQNGGPLLPVQRVRARTAAALGVSPATVSRIIKEKYGPSGMEDNELRTPAVTRRRKKRGKTDQPNRDNLNSDNDSVVPNLNISNETGKNATGEVVTTEKTNQPNNRKRKLESEAFNVDKFLNYVPKSIKTAPVIQDCAPDNEISKMSASDTAAKDVFTEYRHTPQIKNNEKILRKSKSKGTVKESILKINNNETKIDNPAIAITQNNKTVQHKVNTQVLKDNCLNCLDIEHCELKSYKIYTEKSQTVIEESVTAQPFSVPVLPEQKINISPVLGGNKKAIAKANFKVGRIKNNYCESGTGITERFNIESIKDHVKAYHTKKVTPGIKTLMVSLRDSGLFNGSKETLLQILEKIGFMLKRPDII